MDATTVRDEQPTAPTDTRPHDLPGDGSRLPGYLLVLVLSAALVFFRWAGRTQWFFLDEWDFLATRDGGSVADLFASHNVHWTTIPIILYRILWNVFGLHTYLPYQAMTLLGHVAVAALVFLVIRRAGVNPWVALAAVTLFAFFGPGDQNIVWAFQITFVGALAFGLAQLYLAYHDGPVDRRDSWALVMGLLAMLFCGVALAMIGVVGLAMLLRRGWKVALMQTAPLLVVYGTWYVFYGRDGGNGAPRAEPMDVLRFAGEGLKGTYRELGQLPGLGIVMAAVMVVGLGIFLFERGLRAALYEAALPLSMLAGSVAFLLMSGFTRVNLVGASFGDSSRYLYLVAALSIPALAFALDVFARRWRATFPLAFVLLLLPIPWNIDDARHPNLNSVGDKGVVVLADMDGLQDVPTDRVVAPQSGRAQLTLGWLRQAGRDGELPGLDAHDRSVAEVNYRLRLALDQTSDPASGTCTQLDKVRELTLEEGQQIGIEGGPVQVLSAEPGGSPYNSVRFHPLLGPTLRVEVPGVTVRFRSVDPADPASLCL